MSAILVWNSEYNIGILLFSTMSIKKSNDLGKALGSAKTDKRLDILRKIEDAGSISQAARMSGVSYKAAWQAIDVLSNLAGTPLVEKVVGGAGGGGARLSLAGKNLLHASAELTQMKEQLMRQSSAASKTHSSSTKLLGLRTTMRNQFPSTVKSVVKKGAIVRVGLTTKGGNFFHASITSTSAELFELKENQQILALCKATAVNVYPYPLPKQKNVISGIVIRKSRSKEMGEVNLLIEPGITLAGMTKQTALLKIGDEAYADIDATAWVLALPEV